MTEPLLTVKEFADAVRCTVGVVRKWARARRIATIKISKLLRIPASEVDRLITKGMRPATHSKPEDK